MDQYLTGCDQISSNEAACETTTSNVVWPSSRFCTWYFSTLLMSFDLLESWGFVIRSIYSQVSDVFQEKVVGITCYKHKFGIVGKGKHSRIRFSMFPTWEIGFGCHVILILKVIDFIQKYIMTLYVTVTNKVIFVFFHEFNVEQLK